MECEMKKKENDAWGESGGGGQIRWKKERQKKKISVVKCSGEERGVERKTSSGQMRNEKTRDWRRCDLTCSAAITL